MTLGEAAPAAEGPTCEPCQARRAVYQRPIARQKRLYDRLVGRLAAGAGPAAPHRRSAQA